MQIINILSFFSLRFSVDLLCGLTPKSDVALHVNPRFDERRVVRNSRQHDRWGEEEAASPQPVPIKRGEAFYLYIFVTDTHFLVNSNSKSNKSYNIPIVFRNMLYSVFQNLNK